MGDEDNEVHGGMTNAEMRDNVIRLVFGGDAQRYDEFISVLGRAVPADAAAVLRGSAVTGVRAADGAPFDADGFGTSDLDLTIVGESFLDWFAPDGFYIPNSHTMPLSEDHPDIAPGLVPLRHELTQMVGRPVNIQGTRDWVMFVREYVMGQPYLTLFGKLQAT